MNTYHTTVSGNSVWIDEDVMAYTIRYPLKNHENIQEVEISDLSLVGSIGAIIQDDTLERYIVVPLSNKIDVVAKGVTLYFDSSKVFETCQKQTFYNGLYYAPCECCVERYELTEEEYDPDDERFRLEDARVKYLIPIPNVRFTVSY